MKTYTSTTSLNRSKFEKGINYSQASFEQNTKYRYVMFM